MVEVELIDVAQSSGGTALLLLHRSSVRVLPVFVGPAEALALSHALVARSFSRPMTYELVHGMLSSLGAEVQHVRIESLKRPNGVFIGLVTLEIGGEEKELDARPSDAINLAVRSGASIYVAPSVMEVAMTVANVTSASTFRPKGAELLSSKKLQLVAPAAEDAESAGPVAAATAGEVPLHERSALLSEYVQALVEDDG